MKLASHIAFLLVILCFSVAKARPCIEKRGLINIGLFNSFKLADIILDSRILYDSLRDAYNLNKKVNKIDNQFESWRDMFVKKLQNAGFIEKKPESNGLEIEKIATDVLKELGWTSL
ncbi:uncharacterized protein LOC141915167 [Tubulanus polymorphus]|uniref:uncharacterized protein LOC141915167 n=1 Tax=Tubulanus polymorphus TaxID=672921 RepID=UPI003DA40CA5